MAPHLRRGGQEVGLVQDKVEGVASGVAEAKLCQELVVVDGRRLAGVGDEHDERVLQRAHTLSHAGRDGRVLCARQRASKADLLETAFVPAGREGVGECGAERARGG